MKASEAKRIYLDSLAAIIGPLSAADMKVELDAIESRYLKEFERRVQDAEASRLLPLGPDIAAERLGVCRRSVYYMSERARKRVQANA